MIRPRKVSSAEALHQHYARQESTGKSSSNSSLEKNVSAAALPQIEVKRVPSKTALKSRRDIKKAFKQVGATIKQGFRKVGAALIKLARAISILASECLGIKSSANGPEFSEGSTEIKRKKSKKKGGVALTAHGAQGVTPKAAQPVVTSFRTRRGSVHHFTHVRPIAEGGVNYVDRVHRCSVNLDLAFRHPKPGKHEIHERKDIMQYDELLNRVHAAPLFAARDNSAIGVQLPNHEVVYLDDSTLPSGLLQQIYADGDLFDAVVTKRPSPERAISLALQTAFGTANIHAADAFGMDLKPENMLLNGNRADHADLGARRRIVDKADFESIPADSKCGNRTPNYLSASDYNALLKAVDDRDIDQYNMLMGAMDVMATASIIFVILTGDLPYETNGIDNTANLYRVDLLSLWSLPGISMQQKADLVQLLNRALDVDPAKRPTAEAFAYGMADIFAEEAEAMLR